jgi:ferredoxin/flavodoxin
MKAIIVNFSPGGNTHQVARQFADAFRSTCDTVETVSLARNASYLSSRSFRNNLYKLINEFNILCVGSPVYAHHLHYNVADFLRSLLPVEGTPQMAVPFVTFGGINSGVALHEAEILLKKAERKVVAGLKVNSEHCLSKAFSSPFNEGLPNGTAIPHIRQIVRRLASIQPEYVDDRDFLNYQKLGVRIRSRLLIGEKFWHRHMYPDQKFDYAKCEGCGACARVCPMLRIDMIESRPVIQSDARDCIHCGSCVFGCKSGACTLDADLEKWEKLFRKAASGKGPLPSREEPKTNAYFAKLWTGK